MLRFFSNSTQAPARDLTIRDVIEEFRNKLYNASISAGNLDHDTARGFNDIDMLNFSSFLENMKPGIKKILFICKPAGNGEEYASLGNIWKYLTEPEKYKCVDWAHQKLTLILQNSENDDLFSMTVQQSCKQAVQLMEEAAAPDSAEKSLESINSPIDLRAPLVSAASVKNVENNSRRMNGCPCLIL